MSLETSIAASNAPSPASESSPVTIAVSTPFSVDQRSVSWQLGHFSIECSHALQYTERGLERRTRVVDAKARLLVEERVQPTLQLPAGVVFVVGGVHQRLLEVQRVAEARELQLPFALAEQLRGDLPPVDQIAVGAVSPLQREVPEVDEDAGAVGHALNPPIE